MRDGWAKIKAAAAYAGVNPRTVRSWLKMGLRHVRLPSGLVLIAYDDIDAYLRQFKHRDDRLDEIAADAVRGLR